jgi:uncharacterized protein (DUF2267 family)
MTNIPAIEHAAQKAHEWVNELQGILQVPSERSAYAALRAVLHQLRDRLPVSEVTDLGAQLPTLIRGIYYESWNTRSSPQPIHHAKEFTDDLIRKLHGHDEIHAESAIRAVFLLLSSHISKGEIDDVIATLPDEIKAFWPPHRVA